MNSKPVPPLRILVVDDEDMVRDTLRRVLEHDSHLVEEAGNANDALYALQDARFDLVITDYDMAGMRGDRLAAAIKALVPAQPIIMLTAYAEKVQDDPSLMKDLDGVVPKPFGIEALREAIGRALAGKDVPPVSARL
jgi:two-component system, cell cycle sensor histidine kinase and response regulator CckA